MSEEFIGYKYVLPFNIKKDAKKYYKGFDKSNISYEQILRIAVNVFISKYKRVPNYIQTSFKIVDHLTKEISLKYNISFGEISTYRGISLDSDALINDDVLYLCAIKMYRDKPTLELKEWGEDERD